MTESQDDSYARLGKEIADLPKHEIGHFQRFLERRGRGSSATPVPEVQHGHVCKDAATKIVGMGKSGCVQTFSNMELFSLMWRNY